MQKKLKGMSLLENVKINKKDYKVNDINFYDKVYQKRQIVLGNTFSNNMNHYIGWMCRQGGDYKRTAPYTIDKYGEIFEHFDPQYYSDFTNVKVADKHIIPVLLENEGYLISDIKKGNTFYDYLGREYKGGEIITKKWRTHEYWVPYTNEQLESAVNLVKYLLGEFDIEPNVVGHNTKFDDIYNYNGVCYRSNYNKIYTDINPTWDFNKFKEKINNDD